MLTLKDRIRTPPDGYWVTVPQARFNKQFWDFNSAVQALLDVLAANPGLTVRFPQLPKNRAQAEQYVDIQNAQRVQAIPGGMIYLQEGGVAAALPFRSPTPHFGGSGPVAAASQPDKPPGWFKQLGTGVATLADWLGAGATPVSAELSEQRSTICASCPKNQQGNWFANFTVPASNLIRRQLDQREQMKLSTTNDAKMGICEICGCPLRLVLHVPLDVKLRHMPSEQQAKLPSHCWILREQK